MLASQFPESQKPGSALSWTTLFDIPGPKCSRGQESRDVES
jgi:hypothetical protein